MTQPMTTFFDTDHGPFLVSVAGGALAASGLAGPGEALPAHGPLTEADEALVEEVRAQVAELLAGLRERVDVPRVDRGTAFQQAVWGEVARIPRGQTRSYGEVARAIGRPTALRAIGAANRANPFGVIVPCHRLVGADGRPRGDEATVARKERLLAAEAGRPGQAEGD